MQPQRTFITFRHCCLTFVYRDYCRHSRSCTVVECAAAAGQFSPFAPSSGVTNAPGRGISAPHGKVKVTCRLTARGERCHILVSCEGGGGEAPASIGIGGPYFGRVQQYHRLFTPSQPQMVRASCRTLVGRQRTFGTVNLG